MSSNTQLDLFPEQTPAYILSFQFSSWYPTFSDVSIKSTIVRPLSGDFREYLESESVFVPAGSENAPPESTLSDDEGEGNDGSDEEGGPSYAFPELDAKIRECINQYGAVFPKLNFTSPRDASWILPPSSPLKCTSPADVYLLLKSSDFVNHDVNLERVFEGCSKPPAVHDGSGSGAGDYDATQEKIVASIVRFWEDKIKPRRQDQSDYIFDFLLTRDLTRGHILDFNPYAPRTDSLLFSYEDLRDLAAAPPSDSDSKDIPEFRYIDSPSHPAASRNAPTNQHNMVPYEAIELSSGKDIEEFAELWKTQVQSST
ncbi:hypothetical protein EST38_g1330 [Candolleomyces aberdarensis]|uniref:Uncharacterized protein n=1 Tax=Candolleomyces aberdarensis TaxID=2316362 RepID=A0A4Q2DV42_9AGAR|nr:hypothetical protein EST38_g1330 [Candolleomyces aberdarensis]